MKISNAITNNFGLFQEEIFASTTDQVDLVENMTELDALTPWYVCTVGKGICHQLSETELNQTHEGQ